MCSLIPGIPGLSHNIKVISVLDRFLEHSRVYVFHNGGDTDVYISSADWMTRNIDHRVEVGVPIYDLRIKQQILDIMQIQLKDNVKGRHLDANQTNSYVKRGNRRNIRSQQQTYEYLAKLQPVKDT